MHLISLLSIYILSPWRKSVNRHLCYPHTIFLCHWYPCHCTLQRGRWVGYQSRRLGLRVQPAGQLFSFVNTEEKNFVVFIRSVACTNIELWRLSRAHWAWEERIWYHGRVWRETAKNLNSSTCLIDACTMLCHIGRHMRVASLLNLVTIV